MWSNITVRVFIVFQKKMYLFSHHKICWFGFDFSAKILSAYFGADSIYNATLFCYFVNQDSVIATNNRELWFI